MCKTLYYRLEALRVGYSDIYFDLCNEVNSGNVSMDSNEGAFISLYKLIEQGLTEAIDLSPDSYYIIQALYTCSGRDIEQLRKLSRAIAGTDRGPFE